jgi:hypothetical protein
MPENLTAFLCRFLIIWREDRSPVLREFVPGLLDSGASYAAQGGAEAMSQNQTLQDEKTVPSGDENASEGVKSTIPSSGNVQGQGEDFSQLQPAPVDNIGSMLGSIGSLWQSTKASVAQARKITEERASQASPSFILNSVARG